MTGRPGWALVRRGGGDDRQDGRGGEDRDSGRRADGELRGRLGERRRRGRGGHGGQVRAGDRHGVRTEHENAAGTGGAGTRGVRAADRIFGVDCRVVRARAEDSVAEDDRAGGRGVGGGWVTDCVAGAGGEGTVSGVLPGDGQAGEGGHRAALVRHPRGQGAASNRGVHEGSARHATAAARPGDHRTAGGRTAGSAGHLRFTVVTRDDGKKFVYAEAQGTSTLQTDPQQAALAAARYGIIRSQALSPRESSQFIEKLLGEL